MKRYHHHFVSSHEGKGCQSTLSAGAPDCSMRTLGGKGRRRRVGFTLIELLVVVSIITLLVSILLPALSKARVQAYRVICATQLAQMGVSYNYYAADNNDHLPPYNVLRWYHGWKIGTSSFTSDSLRAFFFTMWPTYMPEKIMFFCPVDKTYTPNYEAFFNSYNTPRWSYYAFLGKRIDGQVRPDDRVQYDRTGQFHEGFDPSAGRNVLFGDWRVEFDPINNLSY